MECKCSMAQKAVGDGCELCNPALALDIAKERIGEMQTAINEFCSGQDWASDSWKAQKHISALFDLRSDA